MRTLGLAVASAALSAATALRRALLRGVELPAPVVSVGNLCAGGAGKTPLVEHLARECVALGARPVVLSRGYGPPVPGAGLNDEGCVLRENVPGLAQRQGADRVAAGRAALAAGEGDCLLLDDGLQHFRLARDLDVVALDARSPFSGGLRREGGGGLRRAGAVVLTRVSRVPREDVAAARAGVARLAPGAALALSDHEPLDVLPLGGGASAPAASLRGEAVFACAGIADPGAFLETLGALGARVVGGRAFPDHGLASWADLAGAAEEARGLGAARIVVTQKDAVKIAASGGRPPAIPVAALRVRLRILEGEAVLREALRAALERGRRRAAARP